MGSEWIQGNLHCGIQCFYQCLQQRPKRWGILIAFEYHRVRQATNRGTWSRLGLFVSQADKNQKQEKKHRRHKS